MMNCFGRLARLGKTTAMGVVSLGSKQEGITTMPSTTVSFQQKKVWFITGASRGFGAEIAKDALERGDMVVATARNPQTAVDTFGRHPSLLAVKLDVTREADAVQAAKLAVEKFGRIDVLVNNAGYGLLGAVEETSAEEVERIFRTNVFGLLHITRAVLPTMRQQRSGHIINISSLGGYRASAGWGIYCSTKFAVEGLTEALHDELAPLGIHATVVEPGFFRTDFMDNRSLGKTEQQIADYADTVGKTRVVAVERNHQQPGDPSKLAEAILQLANAAEPPLRLPLGRDALQRTADKNTFVAREATKWRTLAESTSDWKEARR
jgi:NAD(P)-dependent dehydrogenase (short-subunit alcohol dehydrogenase family)